MRSMSATLDAQQSLRVEMQPTPKVATQPPQRVTPHAPSHPATTTPPPPPSKRYTARQRHRGAAVSTTVRSGPPSSNTRSKTKPPPPPTPPPVSRTRFKRRTSKLHQPATTTRPGRTKGFAAVVEQVQAKRRIRRRLSQRISRMENEVHQAMAVMDKETGKLLNYRQLLNHPK